MTQETTKHTSPRAPWIAVGLIMGALSTLTLTVMADGDPTTDAVPRMLPYHGMLELNGAPVHAVGDEAIPLRFELYDGPEGALVYQQTQRVEVFGGRFTATIGPVGDDGAGGAVAITDVVSAADDLHLGMTLLNNEEDPDDDVTLANRQRLAATPYALWSTSAARFEVATDLNVGRDLRVGGDVDLAANTIDGDEITDGTITLGDIDTAAVFGEGLAGAPVGVDTAWLDGRIRGWVRGHCKIVFGHRDNCSGCTDDPTRFITARANNTCAGAPPNGTGGNTKCRNAWAGLNFSGEVDGNDILYMRLDCD